MRFLLSDGPFSGLTHQPMPIGIHEPPGMIEESSDDLYRARVEIFEGSSLRFFEFCLVNLSIPSLAPPPILCDSRIKISCA